LGLLGKPNNNSFSSYIAKGGILKTKITRASGHWVGAKNMTDGEVKGGGDEDGK
jgi:hypothetical protein